MLAGAESNYAVQTATKYSSTAKLMQQMLFLHGLHRTSRVLWRRKKNSALATKKGSHK